MLRRAHKTYSLKANLLFIGLLCALLAILGAPIRRATDLRRSAEFFRSNGADLGVRRDGRVIFPSSNDSLWSYVGAYPVGVVAIDVDNRAAPALIGRMKEFSYFEIIIADGDFGACIFDSMHELGNVKSLGIGGAAMRNSDWHHLLKQKELRILDISSLGETRNIDEFLEQLECGELKRLSLHGICLTDRGLHSLSKARRLKAIEFSGDLAGVTDHSMAALAELPRLETLELVGTSVTDRGLQALRRSATLKSINLDGSLVTDTSIDVVMQWPNVTKFSAENCCVSDAGVRRLSRELSVRRDAGSSGGSAGQ